MSAWRSSFTAGRSTRHQHSRESPMLDGSNISHAPALDSDESVERKYLFLYPDIATPAIKEIESGTFPKERLTGYFQLKQMGLKVAISDSQWRGPTAKLRRKLLRYGQDRKSTRLNSSHVAISYA